MKLKTLTLSLLLGLAATSAFAEAQYQVRIPANVNLSAPEAPAPPAEPISLALSAEAPPVGMVGQPYSFNLLDRLTITGGSGSHNQSETAWSLRAGDTLPPGLSLSGSLISGTPTVKNEAGTSFEVTGTYQDASGKQVYTIVVNGMTLRVTQLAAGPYHACAVVTGGGVKCWGHNGSGRLGDGTTTGSLVPVDVSGLSSGVASVAVGDNHTCAVTTSGGVKCWGDNGGGQLGNGTPSAPITTPVNVSGLSSGVASISAGVSHTCAVTTSGGAKCWGGNGTGQLGHGSTATYSATPVNVSGLTSGVENIATGDNHTCAITTAGGVKCWGRDFSGQLGNGGANTDTTTPVDVSGLAAGVSSIDSKYNQTCAIVSGGVKCWGLGFQNTPTNVAGLSSGIASVAMGNWHTCALTTEGGVKCWGSDGFGQLGDDATKADKASPVFVSSLTSGAVKIVSGQEYTCALMSNQDLKCWGRNNFGQLGNGDKIDQPTPVKSLP